MGEEVVVESQDRRELLEIINISMLYPCQCYKIHSVAMAYEVGEEEEGGYQMSQILLEYEISLMGGALIISLLMLTGRRRWRRRNSTYNVS